MPIVYKEVEVDITLNDFTTEDLIEELESRDGLSDLVSEGLHKIWQLRREGKPFDAELDAYLYKVLGKAI